MSNIIEECKRLISRDDEGFQRPDFKHAQYLVDLLPDLNSGAVSDKFQDLEEKEKEVDKLVQQIVHSRVDEFTSLISKPTIYGEKYDTIKKTVSTSRKRIRRSRELLSKKNNNLKGYLFNSIHNKEILSVLEKIERCNKIFVQIDALMKNESFYEMSLSLLELRKELNSFDVSLKDTAVVKHLQENEKYKTQEAFHLIQRFLKRFFFFFEYEFAIKSYTSKIEGTSSFQFDKINLEAQSNVLSDNLSRRFLTMNQVQAETFNDVLVNDYGVDLDAFKYFENKLNQIRVILQSTPKNYVFDYVEDEYLLAEPEVFENIHILKYIAFSLEVNQFNKYLELICKAEDLLDQESFSSTKSLDIMNLFLALRSAEMTKVLPQVFSDYYGNLKRNVHDSLLLVQMFLLKNVWSSQKEETDFTFQDGDESNTTLYHSLSQIQDQQTSLLSLTSLADVTPEKTLVGEKRRDLLTLYNYNPRTTRHLVQLFKEILMFETVFIRKNILLQLMVTNIKDNISNLPIINIKNTWKEFILELDFLFDKIFMLEKIDFTLFHNPKESHILYEASLAPGSPFYDDLPKANKPSQLLTQGGPTKSSLLNDFMIQKLIDLMGINFMYIPFILNVLHRPMMLITQQINIISQKTTVKELFQNQSMNENNEEDIANFFHENITKFLLLFKLEYLKLINEVMNNNRLIALQTEKNMVPTQNAPLVVPNVQGKANQSKETIKEEKKDSSKESVKGDNQDETPRESNVSQISHSSTNEPSRKESTDFQPSEKILRRVKFDVKGTFARLKYTIPGLLHLAHNVNMLPSISLYLPTDKVSHMLDLLTWSMNIAYNEINNHLRDNVKGYLVDKILFDPKETDYMKFDEGLFKFTSHLNNLFPYLIKTTTGPSPKDHMKSIKIKYRSYFSGENVIKEEKLLTNEKHIILLASCVDNLEAFLKVCDYVFWNLLAKIPAMDIVNACSEKAATLKTDGAKKTNPTKNTEEIKDAIEKLKAKLEESGLQSFLAKFQVLTANSKEPANTYRQIPEDIGEVGLLRFFFRFTQIVDLMRRCIICLKQEIHLRAFNHLIRQGKRHKITIENNPLELSGHNFTSLYRDIFAIYDPLKNSIGSEKINMIFNDYLHLIAKIIKQAFIRSEKISRPYVKTYLQNIMSLELNLKKLDKIGGLLEDKNSPIINIRIFLTLFLRDEKELLDFVVKNPKRVKPKHIELYIKLQSQANEIKIDQKQEMERINVLNKLSEFVQSNKQQQQSIK